MYTGTRMLQLSGLLALLLTLRVNCTEETEEATDLAPHVFVSVLITNSLHLMPNFFGYLEGLDYPKDRISIWVHTDHNVDGTRFSLSMWCHRIKPHYKSVDCHSSPKWVYPTKDPYSKSVHRYKNKARLRQQALEAAREAGADYMLTLDADCFLVNSRTLQLLIEQNKTIVAPMLDAGYKLAYSNFWMAQDDLGNYEDDDLYMPIVQRDRVGCFSAPMVFGAVLIHLSSPYSENLVYHPPHPKFIGPVNDVRQFAFSARREGVAMHVLNTEFFGYIMEDEKYKDTNVASRDFFQFKLDTLVNHPPVLYSKFMHRQMPIIMNSGLELDAVYVINLARRPERRGRMAAILDELGFNYTIVNAVDGRDLNVSYVEDELGINRQDKYKNLTMRMGEVGCFLSHHSIWKKVVSENQRKVLVLEDDVYFKSYFTKGLYSIMRETKLLALNWDYIYLGRNRVDFSIKEKHVKGTKWLIRPNYSYFTLGYLLSNRGAYKLLAADPFHYMLPVDDFIAIMYGAHPMREYSEQFPVRDLQVYSAHPTLIRPTHYYGQDGRISDTEAETIIDIMEKKEEDVSEVDASHRDNVKKKAVQRQIEAFKMKIKARDEL